MKTSHIILIVIAALIVGAIGFMGIVALIAVPNLTSVQERSQVNADIWTAEKIGRGIEIWQIDNRTGVSENAIEYDELSNIEKYIMPDMIPNSLEDGEFYVVSDNGKIKVAIAKEAEDIDGLTGDAVNYDGTGAGWAYVQGSY